MQQVERLEFTLLDLSVHNVPLLVKIFADEHHHVGFGQKWPKLEHVCLVVEHFTLNLRVGKGLELTAASGVPRPYNESLLDFNASLSNNLVANFDHGLIDGLRISSHLKAAVFLDVRKSVEHVGSGDPHLVKHEPAIVLRVVAELGTNIADFYAFERQVSLKVADRHKEAINTVVIFTNYALSKHSSIVSP